ncbi:MAG: diguanylate cyclase [Acidimicrobiia bacterium]|nr:diguanylate cyclase [Acidimicrobiia bacterium]
MRSDQDGGDGGDHAGGGLEDASVMRGLIDLAPVGLSFSDEAGNVLYANNRWRELTGCETPFPVPLQVIIDLIDPSSHEQLFDAFTNARDGVESKLSVRRSGRDDGVPEFSLSVRRVPDSAHTTIRFVSILNDISELTTALSAVRRSEERFRTVTSSLPVAIYRTDPDGQITWANSWLEELTGFGLDELRTMSAFDLIHPDEREDAVLRAIDTVIADVPFESEHRLVCRDGSIRWVVARSTALKGDDGQVVEHLGNIEDVSAMRARSEFLAHAAAHDPLTGLPNRTSLETLLDRYWTAQPRRSDVGIIFVDLNGFKAVNDIHGHRAGDAVLIEVGRRLSLAIRADDTVSRFGGDEFVILCPGIAETDVLDTVARRASHAVAGSPISHDGREHLITASVGTALGPGPGSDPADLLHRADEAMYLAKRSNPST